MLSHLIEGIKCENNSKKAAKIIVVVIRSTLEWNMKQLRKSSILLFLFLSFRIRRQSALISLPIPGSAMHTWNDREFRYLAFAMPAY